MNKKIIVTIMILALSVFFVACASTNKVVDNNNPGSGNVNLVSVGDSDKLIKFNSSDEFKVFIENKLTQTNSYSTDGIRTLSSAMESSGAMVKSADSQAQAPTAASDYSQTNIQVDNVDEADVVKNDDRYIYMISANKLLIVDAYDAANAKIVSETKLEEEAVKPDSAVTDSKISSMIRPDYYYNDNTVTAKELLLNGDKLVIFAQKNERSYYFEKYDITPRTAYKQVSMVYIYDITDKTSPKLLEKFKTNGNYYQSRMIGNTVYLVSQDYINNYPIITPYVRSEVSAKIASPEIYYFDNNEQNYVLNTITSFDIGKNEIIESKSIAMGYTNSLMVSESNIYIAYQKQRYWARCLGWSCPSYDSGYEKERFYDVVVPLLENDLKTDIEKIISEETDDELEWKKISERLEVFYTDLEDNEVLQTKYADMLLNIQKAISDYDVKIELENSKTIIHKFAISEGKIDYKAKGEVYGTLLNQFSLDEFEGNLRLATTVNVWTQNEQVQHNNVYILDENMAIKGELKGIAEKERIYSARFMGDKLYLVTYRQMDPFFVIDLSDTNKPKVLGELKIPGYSDYLHPFDETHIIGIGKETGENEWGGISAKGLKIALFDVSDFSNPKLVDEVLIGEQGTDSPALHDHKAFLFSKTNGLMVLPVSEVVERKRYNSQYGGYSYSYTTWYGAYAFNVTAKGFEQIGKVEHSKLSQDYYDWWSVSAVTRSLYMDQNLYTISSKYLKISDLSDGLKELNSINLPQIDYGYPTPLIDYGVAESGVAIK